MAIYGLKARIMQGGEISGFVVVGNNGKEVPLVKEKVFSLAESGGLLDWQVVTDEAGEKHLYSDNMSILSIPVYNKSDEKITVVGKLYKEDKLAGYICADKDGIKKGYNLDKVWNMAKNHKVDGITAKRHNNSRTLISDNQILREMPKVNIQ